ncbi:CDP-glycerol glycerophosphotransferase family protein [Aquisalibacillus elongatus]|uniref:CDP-glycerol glycerophosphotransferase (TagB/SpsB family) n=1 Tax=Aquisalibacillus elongatus TaxID=485577 RepID=A0A3N5C783_9BACI|nr:CDP-glycerol glycerophosphotransferase family protein [Aquisalibacillus elongatus]RPF54185.1 CDP-glycerol glycerophosphotransferase (TagB/SpsB family) [Aquisalibacillus elongatus]
MNVIQNIGKAISPYNYGTLSMTQLKSDDRQITINIQIDKDLPSFSRKNTSLKFLTTDQSSEEFTIPVESIVYLDQDNELQFTFNLKEFIQNIKAKEQSWYLQIIKKDLFKVNVYNVKTSKSVRSLLHTQKVFREGFVLTPSKDEHHKFVLDQSYEFSSMNINHLINSVESVQKKENGMLVQGRVNDQLLSLYKPDEIYFVMREREKTRSNVYLIRWNSDSKWSVEIPYDDLPKKNRTLDFYFSIKKESSYYEFRVKLIENVDFSDSVAYLPHYLKGAMEYKPYQTELYSFSIKAKSKTAKLEDLKINNDCNRIKGIIRSDLQFTNETNLVFKERDANTELLYPVSLKYKRGNYYFDCPINKLDLYQTEYHIYDVFIEHVLEENRLLIRLKSSDEQIKFDTMIEQISGDQLFQMEFYITANNRLSFRSIPAPINNQLTYAEFENEQLIIKGEAYLERRSKIDIQDQQLELILRNRETDKELAYEQSVPNIDIGVPFNDLEQLIHEPKEIVDVFVRITSNTYVKEVKLGFEEFEYFKDDYLTKSIIKGHDKSIQIYLTITPSGNLKVESYRQSNKFIDLLHEINESDESVNDIWIVGERPDTAQDTGYHFFKFLRENYPEREVYYVIEKDSKDVENVLPLGNVLFIGTEEHVEKSLQANAFFCSHDIEYILPFKNKDMKNYRNGLRVFLQHGVLGRKNVEYHKTYYKYPFDIFCVSSEDEKKMVIDEFHYDENEVRVTGLSRFDNLFSYKTENKILLIPTWREWLTTKEKFEESEYFQRYKSLIQDPRLNQILEQHQLKLDFYLHYRMQQYLEELDLEIPSNVRIVKAGEEKVQDLLKTSKLMITDYSSVSFDFNFMEKPIIFYHFDFRHFFSKGMLRPRDETFLGDIVHTQHDLIDTLEGYISANFKEKDEVSNRKDQIFTYIDRNNSERILAEALLHSKMLS